MLEPIYLPDNVEVSDEGENTANFIIHPYYPGYGPTLANALRRVLLSSLPGAAITHLKVEGVDHEFTTLDGVKEDIVSLILNLKRVRLSSESDEPVEIVLKAKGEGEVMAGDFETPPGVEIANPKQVVMTITDAAKDVEVRCTVERGRGYIPSETRDRDQRALGTIAIDAIFTPVERVSFKVENARVGQVTDYHKLTMTIKTDGTIKPKDALKQAASVLMDHFKELTGDFEEKLTDERPEAVPEMMAPEESSEEPVNTLNLLQLPSRVHNALERIGITTIEQVLDLSSEQIQDIPGLGEKAIDDIIKARDLYSHQEAGDNSDETPTE